MRSCCGSFSNGLASTGGLAPLAVAMVYSYYLIGKVRCDDELLGIIQISAHRVEE